MDRNYYKQYYKIERNHWWFVARGRMLMNHLGAILDTERELKILNVGVATGRTSELLMQYGSVDSIEFDKECYEFTKDVVKIPILQGSILELPFADNSYDLVCAFDVIEHVGEDLLAASELERVCKPGGIICATVPAFQFLWSQHDVANHHFKRYVKSDFLKLFRSKLLFSTYFNFLLFFPITFFRLLSSMFNRSESTDHKTDSEIELSPAINSALQAIFYLENTFLKRQIGLPVGVSILATFRK